MNQGNESVYIAKDDEAEVAQLRDINGVGEEIHVLTPDAVRQYALNDFGLGLADMQDEYKRDFR